MLAEAVSWECPKSAPEPVIHLDHIEFRKRGHPDPIEAIRGASFQSVRELQHALVGVHADCAVGTAPARHAAPNQTFACSLTNRQSASEAAKGADRRLTAYHWRETFRI